MLWFVRIEGFGGRLTSDGEVEWLRNRMRVDVSVENKLNRVIDIRIGLTCNSKKKFF